MTRPVDVLRIAAGEIGYSRWSDPEQGTKYGRWYAGVTGNPYFGSNGVSFCAMFVSWVCDAAGLSVSGLPGASCGAVLNSARRAGLVLPNPRDAKPGDIVIFDWGLKDASHDHIGFVELNRGGHIQTIEGNTSSGASGSQGNGGGVWRRTRGWGVVQAIIRPRYSEEEIVTPQDMERIADLAANKVWEHWKGKETHDRCYRMTSMLKAMCGIGASDTTDPIKMAGRIQEMTIGRLARMTRMLKAICHVDQSSTEMMDVPDEVAVRLSEEDMERIADMVYERIS